MALQAGVLALVAADQAVKALNDGIQQIGNGPNYLRDGQPESIPGIIGQEVGRSACRRYAEGDFSRLSDSAAAGYEKACRPYLDSIAPGTGPGLIKPFEGGQCVGLGYNADFTYTNDQGARQTFGFDFTGGGLVGTYIGDIQFNQTYPVGVERLINGQVLRLNVANLLNPNGGNPAIENIRRQDGQPDNCGNPAPIVKPPTPIPAPDPGPEPFNPRPDINIDLDVTLNVDGSVNFNIGVGVPIVIRPNFDFSPESGGDGDDGGGGGLPPLIPNPEPGPELPGGNGGFGGDDGFGEPPAGRRWVGCCIRLTSYPLNQPPIPGSVPEDVFPQVVGNIRLVFSASGNRQTDTPVRIAAKHVCVWEPVAKLNPVGVNVDLLPGFGYVYTPYSVPLE